MVIDVMDFPKDQNNNLRCDHSEPTGGSVESDRYSKLNFGMESILNRSGDAKVSPNQTTQFGTGGTLQSK